MTTYQDNFRIETPGRGSNDITREIQQIVQASGIETGLCHIFTHHTSASLMLCENADPTVRSDLETFMARLAPDGDPSYRHHLEGPDDMPAHIRSILTNMDLTVPITSGEAALGTWQGIFLWEHRTHPQSRKVTVTLLG